MSLFLLTRSFHLHLLSLFCFQAALFSVLFQEQISTDDLFHLLIFALAGKTFAFSLGYPLVSGGHKWTRTIDLTLIRRAL